jgi:hypothetical protein
MDIMENYQTSYDKINRDLERLSTWASQWLVTFNATKTVYLIVSRKLNPPPKTSPFIKWRTSKRSLDPQTSWSNLQHIFKMVRPYKPFDRQSCSMRWSSPTYLPKGP